MSQELLDVNVDFVSLVDRAAVRDPENETEPRRFLFYKREGTTERKQVMPTVEELQEALEKAEAAKTEAEEKAVQAEQAREDAVAKADAAKKKNDKDEDEDAAETTKAADARLSKAEQEVADLRKAAAEATQLAKEERDARVTAEFITKAESFSKLAADPRELGPVLKRAAEALDKADFEYLEGKLAAANTAISKGNLFKEMGSNLGGQALPQDAWGKIEKAADDIKKAEPKMSKAQAQKLAMEQNPELQQAYLAEVRGA